jgi:hypothetical protein
MKAPPIMATIMALLQACAANFLYPPVTLDIPFAAGLPGVTIDTNIRIYSTNFYQFYLILHFKEHDPQDRNRVQSLAGTGQTDASGRPINNGLPIPVRLILSRVEGDNIESLIDETFFEQRLESHGANSFSKIITGRTLDPGEYRIRLESLQNIPELSDVSVSFNVHAPPRK